MIYFQIVKHRYQLNDWKSIVNKESDQEQNEHRFTINKKIVNSYLDSTIFMKKTLRDRVE